jgi:HD-GYP domain-containing protein (c-di-GMP phosphodiesterase class II)
VAKDLSIESRIIAVSDVFGALHEDRPYRKGIEMGKIVSIMGELSPHQLDRDCMEALFSVLPRHLQPEWSEASRVIPPSMRRLAGLEPVPALA